MQMVRGSLGGLERTQRVAKLTEQLAQLGEEFAIHVRLVLALVRFLGDHVLDLILGPVFPALRGRGRDDSLVCYSLLVQPHRELDSELWTRMHMVCHANDTIVIDHEISAMRPVLSGVFGAVLNNNLQWTKQNSIMPFLYKIIFNFCAAGLIRINGRTLFTSGISDFSHTHTHTQYLRFVSSDRAWIPAHRNRNADTSRRNYLATRTHRTHRFLFCDILP